MGGGAQPSALLRFPNFWQLQPFNGDRFHKKTPIIENKALMPELWVNY
jgi:uncharacterized membrane protein YwzB